eukprot:5139058-Pleurochrysis_carterae.AAC.1
MLRTESTAAVRAPAVSQKRAQGPSPARDSHPPIGSYPVKFRRGRVGQVMQPRRNAFASCRVGGLGCPC